MAVLIPSLIIIRLKSQTRNRRMSMSEMHPGWPTFRLFSTNKPANAAVIPAQTMTISYMSDQTRSGDTVASLEAWRDPQPSYSWGTGHFSPPKVSDSPHYGDQVADNPLYLFHYNQQISFQRSCIYGNILEPRPPPPCANSHTPVCGLPVLTDRRGNLLFIWWTAAVSQRPGSVDKVLAEQWPDMPSSARRCPWNMIFPPRSE